MSKDNAAQSETSQEEYFAILRSISAQNLNAPLNPSLWPSSNPKSHIPQIILKSRRRIYNPSEKKLLGVIPIDYKNMAILMHFVPSAVYHQTSEFITKVLKKAKKHKGFFTEDGMIEGTIMNRVEQDSKIAADIRLVYNDRRDMALRYWLVHNTTLFCTAHEEKKNRINLLDTFALFSQAALPIANGHFDQCMIYYAIHYYHRFLKKMQGNIHALQKNTKRYLEEEDHKFQGRINKEVDALAETFKKEQSVMSNDQLDGPAEGKIRELEQKMREEHAQQMEQHHQGLAWLNAYNDYLSKSLHDIRLEKDKAIPESRADTIEVSRRRIEQLITRAQVGTHPHIQNYIQYCCKGVTKLRAITVLHPFIHAYLHRLEKMFNFDYWALSYGHFVLSVRKLQEEMYRLQAIKHEFSEKIPEAEASKKQLNEIFRHTVKYLNQTNQMMQQQKQYFPFLVADYCAEVAEFYRRMLAELILLIPVPRPIQESWVKAGIKFAYRITESEKIADQVAKKAGKPYKIRYSDQYVQNLIHWFSEFASIKQLDVKIGEPEPEKQPKFARKKKASETFAEVLNISSRSGKSSSGSDSPQTTPNEMGAQVAQSSNSVGNRSHSGATAQKASGNPPALAATPNRGSNESGTPAEETPPQEPAKEVPPLTPGEFVALLSLPKENREKIMEMSVEAQRQIAQAIKHPYKR